MHRQGVALVLRGSASKWKIRAVHVMVPASFYVQLNTLEKRCSPKCMVPNCRVVTAKWLPSRGHLCCVPSFLVESSDSSCQWNASRSDVHHSWPRKSVCLHHSLPFWLDAEDPVVLKDGRTLGRMKPTSWRTVWRNLPFYQNPCMVLINE